MKRRLIREAISEEQQEQYLNTFFNIDGDERKKIKNAIKECLKPYGLSVGFLSGFSLIGVMVLVIGIKFKNIETIIAGFTMLASGGITLGTLQRKQILECAAEKLGMDLGDMLSKMRGKDEESSETMPESRRIVKLTESELINLVQRIIKEDEMMSGPPKDTFCSVDLKKVEKNSTVSSIQGGKSMRTNGKELKKGDLLNSKTIETIKLSQNATIIARGYDEPDSTTPTDIPPTYIITCKGVKVEYGD